MVPNGVAGYVTETDPGAIATAIFDFYSNNKEQLLSEGVKKEAARFSWESFAEAITDQTSL
jgi:D-inositol-3-phosphate glycosyltransferase